MLLLELLEKWMFLRVHAARDVFFSRKIPRRFGGKKNEAPPDNKLGMKRILTSDSYELPGIWKKCAYKMIVSIEIIPNL